LAHAVRQERQQLLGAEKPVTLRLNPRLFVVSILRVSITYAPSESTSAKGWNWTLKITVVLGIRPTQPGCIYTPIGFCRK